MLKYQNICEKATGSYKNLKNILLWSFVNFDSDLLYNSNTILYT